MKDLIFRLVPWGVISGRIADENGDPIPGTSVEAMRHFVDEGKRTLQAVQTAETNDLGEFRLYGLSKGRYFVRAQIRGEWQPSPATSNANDSATDETGYSPVYYPGTTDEARAATIEVIAGQEVPAIDFTLIPVRSFRVTGHVFDAVLGQPAKDCFVVLLRRDPNTSGFFFNDQAQASCQKGSFEFSSVPPGSYYVSAMSSSGGKRRVARAAVEVEGSNVNDVGMTLVQGANITGRILIEGHEAMDFSDVHLWLTDPEQYFNGGAGAVVKPDGTLTIENLAEGHYRIQTHSMPPGVPADFYLKDAQANGESILDKALTIVAGGNQVSLEITMSSAGARVDGTVTDENDLPICWRRSSRSSQKRPTQTVSLIQGLNNGSVWKIHLAWNRARQIQGVLLEGRRKQCLGRHRFSKTFRGSRQRDYRRGKRPDYSPAEIDRDR